MKWALLILAVVAAIVLAAPADDAEAGRFRNNGFGGCGNGGFGFRGFGGHCGNGGFNQFGGFSSFSGGCGNGAFFAPQPVFVQPFFRPRVFVPASRPAFIFRF